jgi:T-complex protein 1 subunit beta
MIHDNKNNFFLFSEVKKIVDFVKSTLGPKGMDKILFSKSGMIKVTNDGATILRNAASNSLILNIIRDICNVQDNEIGDGTTSVCCLIGELIIEAEKLISLQIHPQIVIKGFRNAAKEALQIIEKNSFDNSGNLKLFCNNLLSVAKTTLNSKIIFPFREHFGRIAVKAVLKLKGSTNINQIQIIKKCGGSLRNSFLEDGFILEKKIGVNQPKRIQNPKILIANTQMDIDKIKIQGAKIRVKSLSKLAEIEVGEQKKILDKCKKIIKHKINIFINRQLIYNRHERFFSEHGIITIEHADFEGIERLALVTGAEITSTFDEPSKIRLGKCKIVEEILIGDEAMIRFGGCYNGDVCSIILRGSNLQIIDEAERSLHDALCILSQVIRNPQMVWGAGAIETQIASDLEKFSKKFTGKKGIIIKSFAKAVQNLPRIIADNAGIDSTNLINELKIAHENDKKKSCLDLEKNEIGDAKILGFFESSKLKKQIIISAIEAVEMIIRIDNTIIQEA